MSLIREALKKAGNGKEPEILMPERDGRKKKRKSPPRFQYILLTLLVLVLVGTLAYIFLPGKIPLKKISGPPPPQPQIKPVEKKPQELVALGGKEVSPLPSQQKAETKVLPSTAIKEAKESPEKEKVQKSEKFFKRPSHRFLSPRPAAKSKPKPPLPPEMVTQTKPPRELPEPSVPKPPSEGTDPLPLIRLFNDSVKNQQKGLYAQAIQGYQEILAERPNHWEIYNNLGLIYQKQKQYTRSLELFQKALSLNPRYLKGYNNLGLLYLTLGKLEEAVQQFKKALELDSEFIPAYINLAVAYKRQGHLDLARKSLESALARDSENLEAHYNLGLLWEQEGVENKALEHFQKFVTKAQGPYGNLANELRKKWPGLK